MKETLESLVGTNRPVKVWHTYWNFDVAVVKEVRGPLVLLETYNEETGERIAESFCRIRDIIRVDLYNREMAKSLLGRCLIAIADEVYVFDSDQ